jgi:hypothetical protein
MTYIDLFFSPKENSGRRKAGTGKMKIPARKWSKGS